MRDFGKFLKDRLGQNDAEIVAQCVLRGTFLWVINAPASSKSAPRNFAMLESMAEQRAALLAEGLGCTLKEDVIIGLSNRRDVVIQVAKRAVLGRIP